MPDASLDSLVGQDIDTVAFVRDYIELRIDYSIVRALTPPTGMIDGIAWRFDEPGAADIMRRYIGKWVSAVELIEDERLSLMLDGGGTFDISLRPEDRVGPEAAHFVPAGTAGSLDVVHMSVW